MPAPTVHPATRRLYDRLPEFYRAADEAEPSGGGWPLLRFLSLIGDQAGAIEDLIDRVDPPGSHLLDAYAADVAWLPWLAQIVGLASLPDTLTVAEKRNAIDGAVTGRLAGTRGAIEQAAKTALTDPNGYVAVRDNYLDDPYTVGVSIDPAVKPADPNTVIAAITRAHAKPAGIRLVIDDYVAPWSTIEARYPTWADRDGLTWSTLEQTRL